MYGPYKSLGELLDNVQDDFLDEIIDYIQEVKARRKRLREAEQDVDQFKLFENDGPNKH